MDEQKIRNVIAYLEKKIAFAEERKSKYKNDENSEIVLSVIDERINHFSTAIEALEKQLTVKTTKFGDFIVYHNCPKCKEFVPLKVNYCCNCGQKLEWSD